MTIDKYFMKLTPCAFAISLVFTTGQLHAQTTPMADGKLPLITVIGTQPQVYQQSNTNSAFLLNNEPGYATQAAGGVSSLPVLNGFAADRLKVRLDGMEVTAACGNQMNGPLSYMPPAQVGGTKVVAGITPVSIGGDSIGGSIELSSPVPKFAETADTLQTNAGFSVSARSVNAEVSTAVHAAVATNSLSIGYVGSHSEAQSYVAGNGEKVLGSQYNSNNHALTVAARGSDQQLIFKVGQQYIPYQGFPNQYMDMTGNRASTVNLGYEHRFDWGKLFAKLYWQNTAHEMGFFSSERTGSMPMNTRGRDLGYALRTDINLGNSGTLRLGHEFHSFFLNDYWPPVPGSMMMGPHPYLNINHGKRDRTVLFAEWERKLDSRWTTLIGLRDELVKTDTDNVQAYSNNKMNAEDVAAAAIFNARSRAKTDNNIDFTALTRFEPTLSKSFEFGYARKTRSPNLYERYTWGRGTMAMTMTNWFGDGNGYVGNIDLKPEIANILSATVDWHSEEGTNDGADWFVKLTPYYNYVQNYIDADVIGSFHPYGVIPANANLLQFANYDAQLYGINLSWKRSLFSEFSLGDIDFTGKASMTRGKRINGGSLYHMMPFNVLAALEQRTGSWTNRIEANYVARKVQIDTQRLEPVTASFTVMNIKTTYQANKNIFLSAGVSNLFNRNYADPLGGVYLSGMANVKSGSLLALPGYGRSLDVGMTVNF